MKKFFLTTVTFILITFKVNSQVIRFMAGIEKDLSAEKQGDIIRKSLPNHKVIVYKKNEIKRLLRDSKGDTSSRIILFSYSCKWSYEVITSVLCDVWVVEPHWSSSKVINDCILIGFPKRHIILGPKPNRGFGISKGCSMTPSGLGHFESLKFVSKKIK